MNTTHLMINIYMVTVKGNYQVFALGIRFGSWISVCSRAEWRIGNSVGGTWRDFIRGGRWWWHKTLKLSLSLRISLCISLFLSFLLVPTFKHTFVTYCVHSRLPHFEVWAGRSRRKMLPFQRSEDERLALWPFLSLPSFQSPMYTSPPLWFFFFVV